MIDIIEKHGLINLHKRLDEFAKKHHNDGIEHVFQVANEILREHKVNNQDIAKDREMYDNGYRQGMLYLIIQMNERLEHYIESEIISNQ